MQYLLWTEIYLVSHGDSKLGSSSENRTLAPLAPGCDVGHWSRPDLGVTMPKDQCRYQVTTTETAGSVPRGPG